MIYAEYIESGTFAGGEEDAWDSGIKRGDTVVILTEDEYSHLLNSNDNLKP